MSNKILLVDDSITIRKLYRSYFEELTCNVIEAINGREAITILLQPQHSDVDLILLDKEMPTMDGFSFLIYAKANRLLSHIPIVILTAHGGGATLTRALNLGASGFLEKSLQSCTELNWVHDLACKTRLSRESKQQPAPLVTDLLENGG